MPLLLPPRRCRLSSPLFSFRRLRLITPITLRHAAADDADAELLPRC